MKKSILVLMTVVFLFSGTSLFTSCENNEHSEHQEQKNKDVEKEIYACPKHHGTIGKKGDVCETCGIELTSTKTDTSHKGHNH